jgi:hypothetical protein
MLAAIADPPGRNDPLPTAIEIEPDREHRIRVAVLLETIAFSETTTLTDLELDSLLIRVNSHVIPNQPRPPEHGVPRAADVGRFAAHLSLRKGGSVAASRGPCPGRARTAWRGSRLLGSVHQPGPDGLRAHRWSSRPRLRQPRARPGSL